MSVLTAPKVLPTSPQRISDVVDPWAEQSPNHPALVEAAGAWTYSELHQRIRETQTWLLNLSIRPGDRVMLVCENCRALAAILFALSAIDAWPVLVSARLSSTELDQIQNHCSPRRIIYTTGVSAHAKQHAKAQGAAIEDVPALGLIGIGGVNESTQTEPIDGEVANRVAALIYTSGSTGLPKGVMLTHRNLLFVADASASIRKLGQQDRLYGVLPISHAVGLSVVLLGSLLSGATLYLATRFDPVSALATLEKEKLTVMLGAPAMFSLLCDYAKLKNVESLNLSSLRIISSSSAPLQQSVKTEVENLFGKVLHNGYGVTECSPNIAQTRPESPRRDTSVGKVLPGIEVKLIGVDGKMVATGDIGELSVRGPNVMRGYYRNPEETASALDRAGWFNTRDLARFEDDHLFIVGRAKELIVHFGFNVYPAEVEAVLNTHPAVVRSAVMGGPVKGTEGDEEILAFVQLSKGSTTTLADLGKHAAEHLAPYKRPSRITLVQDMPLTATGKVKKEDLKKLFASA